MQAFVKRNIPFSPPDISELEIEEVADALRSFDPAGLQLVPEQRNWNADWQSFVIHQKLSA